MISFSPLSHIFLVAFTMIRRICKKLLKYTNVSREVYYPLCEDIQDSLLDSKAQDSRFHILKFPGMRNLDYLTWFEVYFSGVITSLNSTLFFGRGKGDSPFPLPKNNVEFNDVITPEKYPPGGRIKIITTFKFLCNPPKIPKLT